MHPFAEKCFKVCEAFVSWSSVVTKCDKEDKIRTEYPQKRLLLLIETNPFRQNANYK